MRRRMPSVLLALATGLALAAGVAARQEAPMVITVLQAEVDAGRAADLERAYRERTAELPADIVESWLVRDAAVPARFQIVTVWRSRAALDAMRASGVTPTGVAIFQAAGATPSLSVLDVVVHRTHTGRHP